MPSKQSEAVRRRWEAARLAMAQPEVEGPDDESWGDLTAEPREVDYTETEAGGRPAMWLVPKRARTDRVLLCLHGGGFVSGSIYTHRKMFGHLAKATGRDPLASPLHADLTGLGPVYIQVGGDETLLDDARSLDEHARKAGLDIRLDVFPGMLHTFQMAAGRAPEADDAIRKMAAWVRPRLGL